MTRACLGLLLVAACNPVERAKRELAFVQSEERRVQAEVRAAGLATNSLERAVSAQQARLASAARSLVAAQTEVAANWRGADDELAAQLAAAPALTKPLRAALLHAQASGSREVRERRFATALDQNDLAALGPLVSNLAQFEPDADAPIDAGVASQVIENTCKSQRVLPCKPIDLDALWCVDGKRHVVHVLIDHGDQVELASLPGGDQLEPAARLAPGVWLNQSAGGDHEFLSVSELRGAIWVTKWYGTNRSAVSDAGGLGAPLERKLVNIDGDEFLEGFFWSDTQLDVLDPTDWNSVDVLRNLTACELLEGSVLPAPVAAWCAKHRAPVDAGVVAPKP